MTEEERELLIACSKAILQLKELVYDIHITKKSCIDLNELQNATDTIEYCLSNIGE